MENLRLDRSHEAQELIDQVKKLLEPGKLTLTGPSRYIRALTDVAREAACIGNTDVLSCLREHGMNTRVDMDACAKEALRNGHLEFFDYLSEQEMDYDVSFQNLALVVVAGCADLSFLDWCHKKGKWFGPDGCALKAADCGNVPIFDWLHQSGWILRNTEECTREASRHGHVSILDWLYRHGYMYTLRDIEGCTLEAAYHGHVPILDWLHRHGYEIDPQKCTPEASKKGHLCVLKWFHTRGLNFSPKLVTECAEMAAYYGHRSILEWFGYNKFPFLEVVTAAQRGLQKDITKLLFEKCDRS